MLYMVVERFRNQEALPVYRRFRSEGRLAPPGLTYVASWVDEQFQLCFQLMETDDRSLLDVWMANWRDLVDFEVFPVMTSAEATEMIAHKLDSENERSNAP
jgi:hypothetical protein